MTPKGCDTGGNTIRSPWSERLTFERLEGREVAMSLCAV